MHAWPSFAACQVVLALVTEKSWFAKKKKRKYRGSREGAPQDE